MLLAMSSRLTVTLALIRVTSAFYPWGNPYGLGPKIEPKALESLIAGEHPNVIPAHFDTINACVYNYPKRIEFAGHGGKLWPISAEVRAYSAMPNAVSYSCKDASNAPWPSVAEGGQLIQGSYLLACGPGTQARIYTMITIHGTIVEFGVCMKDGRKGSDQWTLVWQFDKGTLVKSQKPSKMIATIMSCFAPNMGDGGVASSCQISASMESKGSR